MAPARKRSPTVTKPRWRWTKMATEMPEERRRMTMKTVIRQRGMGVLKKEMRSKKKRMVSSSSRRWMRSTGTWFGRGLNRWSLSPCSRTGSSETTSPRLVCRMVVSRPRSRSRASCRCCRAASTRCRCCWTAPCPRASTRPSWSCTWRRRTSRRGWA
uniref:(northern house mosquito) hypothetical protein n=1 Tax=Culex pipiens TaxID=7175 RepID=A0A8D8JTK6_CULPI